MTTMDNPADIIATLKDIERRSQQRMAGLSQQDNMDSYRLPSGKFTSAYSPQPVPRSFPATTTDYPCS